MYNSSILALEYYAPDNIITNDDLSKVVDTNDEWITTRTGIKKRHLSGEADNTSKLCTRVGRKLLESSGLKAEDIGLIIVATITSDYVTPSTACLVQGNLGCSNAFAFDLSAACTGFVYALSVADKFIKSGQYNNVMVIGAETLSKIVDWEDRATCVLFGDGAGGAILSQGDSGGIICEDLHAKGEDGLKLTGGERKVRNIVSKPEESDARYLCMDGRAIFSFATRTVPKSINTLMEKSGVSLDEVKYIVPHQANSRIIDVVAKKLDLPEDKFYMNLDEFGNTSAASVAIALAQMKEKGLIERGDKLVLTGFGGGLTWGSILLEY
jgi:3-oxoacyl-[acyl-carrier-protein] synthase-3